MLRFSEFTNAEYDEQGIVAFSLHPGGVMTELAGGMPQAMQDGKDHTCFCYDTSIVI